MRTLRLIAFLLIACGSAFSANIFFAQASAGSNNGTSCANAFAYSDVTNGWNTATAQTAGNTLHVCGVFTFGTNQGAILTATHDGSSGLPITLKWEPGASIQASYCASGGCLVLSNSQWWTLDGGQSAGVSGTCDIVNIENGTCTPNIENTLDGSVGMALTSLTVSGGTTTAVCVGSCKPYINAFNSNDLMPVYIAGTGSASCNVKVQPLTSSTSGFTFATPSGCTTTTGGTVAAACPAGACTQTPASSVLIQALGMTNFEMKNFVGGPQYVSGLGNDTNAGNQVPASSVIQLRGTNINLHDSTLHDAGLPVDNTSFNTGSNYTIANVDVYHCGWCVGFAGGNFVYTDFFFTNNHMHDIANWSNSLNGVHGNGIHAYDGSGGGLTAFWGSNNLSDGDMGTTTTSWYYFEGNACGTNDIFGNTAGGSTGTFNFWNNVVIMTAPGNNGVPQPSCGSGHKILNNYIYCGQSGTSSATCYNNDPGIVVAGTGATIENNVFQTTDTLIKQNGGHAPLAIDYNWYADASGGNAIWQIPGTSTSTFATWQAAGFDAHGSAHLASQWPNLNACNTYKCGAGVPSAGFTGISSGVNLTSLCTGNMTSLCSDTTAGGTHVATARSGGAAWDVGAFQFAALPIPPGASAQNGVKFSNGAILK